MKLPLDSNRIIETDMIEGVSNKDKRFYVEMVSGRTHEINQVMYSSIVRIIENSERTKTASAY